MALSVFADKTQSPQEAGPAAAPGESFALWNELIRRSAADVSAIEKLAAVKLAH